MVGYFQVHHLLPNILIGTGKYCRSSKYHDKSVDQANLTENGYLVTGSEGSKYLKIWKIKTPLEYGYSVDEESPDYDLEQTEVRELQILRDHSDYLTVVKVFGNTIYSSCSDGEVRKRSRNIFKDVNKTSPLFRFTCTPSQMRASFPTMKWQLMLMMTLLQLLCLINKALEWLPGLKNLLNFVLDLEGAKLARLALSNLHLVSK